MISAEYAAEVGQALVQNCPHVDANPEAMEAIKARILKYTADVGETPSVDLTLTWAAADEIRLAEAAETQRQADAARAERRRLEGLSAEETRLLAEAEFRAAHPEAERPPLTPNTTYTLAEQEKMSSDEYAVKVLGLPAPSMNLSQPLAKNEKNAHVEYRKKQIMRAPLTRDSRLNQTLRRMVLEGQIK